MHKYEIIKTIGEGAYGVVQKARNKQTKQIVAIKKFKESDQDEMVRKTTNREIQLLKLCSSGSVITLKEAFKQKRIVCLVFEYAPYNLLEVLEKTPEGINPEKIKLYIYQILKGLAYLHSLNVIHRDVKPENLLVNEKDQLKICDFGFARQLKNQNENLTDYVSTRWYRPPQLLVGAKYGKQIDIWSVGCIMAQLIDGNPLFPGDNQIDQLYKIQKCLGQLTQDHFKTFSSNKRFMGIKFPKINSLDSLELRYFGKLAPKGLSLLRGLLKMAPSQRLSAIDALKHPYFDDIRQEDFLFKMNEKKQKLQARKTSATSTPNYPPGFLKSNKNFQYGAPYIKNAKILGTHNHLQREFKRLTMKQSQMTRLDWHSSQLRNASQPPSKHTNIHNKSTNGSQNPKRSSLQTYKVSSTQLSKTQQRFGLSCSKLAINRIYGSKRQNTKFDASEKVLEQSQQNV